MAHSKDIPPHDTTAYFMELYVEVAKKAQEGIEKKQKAKRLPWKTVERNTIMQYKTNLAWRILAENDVIIGEFESRDLADYIVAEHNQNVLLGIFHD